MNKKGTALILSLFVLIFVSLLVVAFLNLTTSELQIASNHLLRNRAFYIASSGIEYAISQLRNNKNWQVASESRELPLGSGNTYSVTYPYNSGKIRSVGSLSSGFSVIVEAKISVTGVSSPFTVKIISLKEL